MPFFLYLLFINNIKHLGNFVLKCIEDVWGFSGKQFSDSWKPEQRDSKKMPPGICQAKSTFLANMLTFGGGGHQSRCALVMETFPVGKNSTLF